MKEGIANVSAHRLPVDTWWMDAGWSGWKNCKPAHLAYGDFDGDGKLDMICNSDDGGGSHIVAFSKGGGKFFSLGSWWPFLAGHAKKDQKPFCDDDHLSYGDFDGDHKLDLICNSPDGNHDIAFSNGDGRFLQKPWWPSAPGEPSSWCRPPFRQFFGDFDGGGALDLICDSGAGNYRVAISNKDGTFSVKDWWPFAPDHPIPGKMPFCNGKHVAYGDFDGTHGLDLICNSGDGGGSHLVAFSNGDGTFSIRQGWWPFEPGHPAKDQQPWCDDRSLSYGDFDGDHKLDLICNSGEGNQDVAFSNGDGTFSIKRWWPSPPGEPLAWCRPPFRQVFGDFDGDGALDLICDSRAGNYRVAISNKDGTFSVKHWWPFAPDHPVPGKKPFCNGEHEHVAYGDFDARHGLDLICNSDSGKHVIAFYNGDGTFRPTQSRDNAVPAYWARSVGNFDPNPVMFPDGLKPAAGKAHAARLKFLLWFEPERVMPLTWMYDHHLDWLIPPPPLGDIPPQIQYMRNEGFHLFNLGIPAARDWLRHKISSMIQDVGIDVYRHDFNMYPLPYWRSLDSPDVGELPRFVT